MQSKIPVPTDNIYKFYALFSLLIFISFSYLLITSIQTYNEQAFSRYIEYETLKEIKSPTNEQKAKLAVIKRQEEIDKVDKKSIHDIMSFVIVCSMLGIIFGFYRWHTKIQPDQDKRNKYELEKLKLEVEMMRGSKPKLSEVLEEETINNS